MIKIIKKLFQCYSFIYKIIKIDNNNNYYKYETPNIETPELIEPNINEKYKNITNISQLSNRSIKQQNQMNLQ